MIVLDFETMPIKQRPAYPPVPIGLAVKLPGEAPRYYDMGTIPDNGLWRSGAPATKKIVEVCTLLARIWASGEPVLFHNAKFDLEVAEKHFKMPLLPWQRVHDTQFLAFLNDPHARSLGLKPLAEQLLGWAPEERDAIADWVVEHKKELKQVDPSEPATPKNAGAWVWAAPTEIVEPYALGDVMRTQALFDFLMPVIERSGMSAAYDRERRLMPILLRNEQLGMRLDEIAIGRDIGGYETALRSVEGALRGALKVDGLNFDADQDVAQALLRSGAVLEADIPLTETGKWSVSKEELRPSMFQGEFGAKVASALGYRNRLSTCLSTFMIPWAKQAAINGGYITTNWNQTRGQSGGTRTGRPSTNNHNFLNLPKSFNDKDDEYIHPAFLGLPALPLCRRYILPDEGETFLHRDFSGQEIRVFAHGSQGALWGAYRDDPGLDPHGWVKAFMEPIAARELPRRNVKVLNFQALYGGGVPALQKKLRCSLDEARALKKVHDEALPDRRIFNEEIKRIILRGEPIRTVGGRLFYAEPPGPDGRDKLYKLINYWVQGSAADITKEALIDWHDDPDRNARFLVTVYDEIDISAPIGEEKVQMALLRAHMEQDRISVKMLSDGKMGPNWGELTKCE
jgi:DNA polymerase I-like protein with 3'-5' exonuclease and polymerase domains